MRRIAMALILVSSLELVSSFNVAVAEAPANEVFLRTWARTDRPVVEGQVSRTWMWGPEAFTGALQEPYAETPGGMRTVQYFDKSRMEITNPNWPARCK